MIVVIADDLTGAAELAGLGIRHNLVTEITTSRTLASVAELLVIATDTRSLSRAAAEAVISEVCSNLSPLIPVLVYKKIDSVLRGHVLAEIQVQMKKLHLSKALIVAANPAKGRTVENGQYLLQGKPIHGSGFAQDPEFPVASSNIGDMLAAHNEEVKILKHQDALPDTGIVIGEVKEAADLAAWCHKIDRHTLVAGAAEFFDALLAHLSHIKVSAKVHALPPQLPFLAIWGSSFHKSRAYVQKMKSNGFPVCYMPITLLQGDGINPLAYRKWIADIVDNLNTVGKAGIAIDPNMAEININAVTIRTIMAVAAADAAAQTNIHEFLIEGGATAAAVIKKLGIETLYPEAELAPGVTRMSVREKDWHLTLKPGSYEWPDFIMHRQYATGTHDIDDRIY
jgi:uncharacterized protein YgbK (DUF1537 family)